MHARAALTVALVAGLLAVALVTADTVWSLSVELDARDDGEWVTVSRTYAGYTRYEGPYAEPFGKSGCSGPEFRLRVDNDKPFADTLRVRATWVALFPNATAQEDGEILDGRTELQAFETATIPLTVPDGAFAARDGVAPERVELTVQAGRDLWYSTCVVKEA